MYSEEIKKDCRKIYTGLKGARNLAIIQSVEGQLSDGMWENSPRMEGYWMFECCELENDEVVIYISKRWGEYRFNRMKCNLFINMTDWEIREWFGKKIKQIIKQEIKDDWKDHPIIWDRKCEEASIYMHDQLTVAECYRAYDHLLGRPCRA